MTALDLAHAAMEAAPEDALARLRFYEAVAESELVLMLAEEPGEALVPALFETADGPLALAFDGEERLAAFTGAPTPYAALPGRALAAALAERGLGLGLNLDAPSAFVMPPAAVAWLAETLATAPAAAAGRPRAVAPPRLPERVVTALDRKLARAEGLAQAALLARVTWEDGGHGHLLLLVGAPAAAEPALAQAVGEALTFSGIEAVDLAIAFAPEDDPLAARLARVALRFDLPPAPRPSRRPPGGDPARPPKLR